MNTTHGAMSTDRARSEATQTRSFGQFFQDGVVNLKEKAVAISRKSVHPPPVVGSDLRVHLGGVEGVNEKSSFSSARGCVGSTRSGSFVLGRGQATCRVSTSHACQGAVETRGVS